MEKYKYFEKNMLFKKFKSMKNGTKKFKKV